MKATLVNFGLYTIDTDYLNYLYQIDKEVFYDTNYGKKPFLGIIVGLNKNKYFIPLTSSKKKHARWRYEDNSHILVYEKKLISNLSKRDVYKKIPGDNKYVNSILSVIVVNKMIPVKDGLFTYVDQSTILDKKYRKLVLKEIQFCSMNKKRVLNKVEKVYSQQKKTGIVRKTYVNFSLLEKACKNYK